MDAQVVEIEISVEVKDDGSPVIDHFNGASYCRLSWPRGAGPPSIRGVYFWMSGDYRILYVGKATSNETSHLYRRITAYKRATPGKTQWTSLRLNSDILGFVQRGGRIRLLCLAMPNADPRDVTRVEEHLIDRAQPPWNRQRNPRPRTVQDATLLTELLEIELAGDLPPHISIRP